MNEARRFAAKHDKPEAGCWLWRGAISDNGYGSFRLYGSNVGAHRAAYILHVGPIPDGYRVDHICRVRHCVRPDHLRVITHPDNCRYRGPGANNTSGFRGVSWNKNAKKWKASLREGGRTIHLGYFTTAQEAGEVAERERIARWGIDIGSATVRVAS